MNNHVIQAGKVASRPLVLNISFLGVGIDPQSFTLTVTHLSLCATTGFLISHYYEKVFFIIVTLN